MEVVVDRAELGEAQPRWNFMSAGLVSGVASSRSVWEVEGGRWKVMDVGAHAVPLT